MIYLSDLKNVREYDEEIKNKVDTKIYPDDLLSITVSSLNPEANILFNNGTIQSGTTNSLAASSKANEGYLVDKNGSINFPVLGKVKLGGLTKEQAIEKMTSEIKNHVKNPIVNIRFINFRITVIGEVTHPSTFTIPNERINIIEALGLAGDMTAYGKRENMLIIREKEGVRSVVKVDLTNKDILNSPYFYLQQNDILYVEPARIKQLQSSSSTFYVPLISAAVSILSLVIIIFK
ncbi:polysaccharide biosynthesis/export family protein [Hymenobacter crusticola]|uniref:polysaccharide biosynthesis/export family protein n=1 Tax=Hymenobacter crusticola TaxID=1770526 RepID=UPI0026C2A244|nr:polysaccharide biosynthesis/export family protein [Hymenobacter crusticola]